MTGKKTVLRIVYSQVLKISQPVERLTGDNLDLIIGNVPGKKEIKNQTH